MTQHDFLHRAVGIRPPKTAPVQLLRTDPKSASVVYQKLQAVAPRIREKENMAARRIAAQMIAHQPVETIEILAHVRRAGCNIDPRRRSKPEHRLDPVQHGQQTFQRSRVESTTHFDPASASRLNYQNTRAPGIALCITPYRRNQFNRKQVPTTRTRLPKYASTIFIQRRHSQAAMPAKCLPLQSTRCKLRNKRLNLRPTTPLPNYSHFAHNSSATLNAAQQQSALL